MWIFGSPRTGSTWLLQQLCDPVRLDDSRPLGFRAPRAPAVRLDALPVSEFLISSHVAPALGDPVERDGEFVPATLNNYLGHKPPYLFAREFEELWRPAVRRLTLVRLHAVHAAAESDGLPLSDGPSLIIKEVNGSHAADLIMSMLPRSRMLFLVRDGRDVVDSLLHAAQEGGCHRDRPDLRDWLAKQGYRPSLEAPAERLEWVRDACRSWACGIDASRRAYASHAPDRRMLVKYEDLVASPSETLGSLAGWLGLDRSDERLEQVVARHAFAAIPSQRRGASEKWRAATPGLWRENLTEPEKAAAREIMGPRLETLGYPG